MPPVLERLGDHGLCTTQGSFSALLLRGSGLQVNQHVEVRYQIAGTTLDLFWSGTIRLVSARNDGKVVAVAWLEAFGAVPRPAGVTTDGGAAVSKSLPATPVPCKVSIETAYSFTVPIELYPD